MALGGGTFLVQNKVLPGSYINFVSLARALGFFGDRGIVIALMDLNWGEEKKIFTVESGDFQKNCMSILGYAYTDNEMLYLREMFKGAKVVKLYRPAGGQKARAVIGNLTATARYSGTRGNDIQIIVEQDIDDEDTFVVITHVGDSHYEADVQYIRDCQDLKNNDFIIFSGSGVPDETAGTKLTGGTDAAVKGTDHSDFLEKAEAEMFTTILYAGTDLVTKSLYAAYTKRLRDDEGYKISAVLYNYTRADFEGVISVKNPIITGDNPAALVYWVAGQTAGAEINHSLTNKIYDGELVIETHYKKSDFNKAIQNGEFAFYGEIRNPYRTDTSQSDPNAKGEIRVLKDINTFTSFEPYKNTDFANNQIIRILDQIANDTARIFDTYYLGKVQNNDTGRSLFRKELIKHRETLVKLQTLQNFSADDIFIFQGDKKEDVVLEEIIDPVCAMEKLYLTVKVA